MPDITMCSGTGCFRKRLCYRAMATPNPHMQSWFVKPPLKGDGTCTHFLDNKPVSRSQTKRRTARKGS